MADKKISSLGSLTNVEEDDLLPIVDVSETNITNRNKKIRIGDLPFGLGGGNQFERLVFTDPSSPYNIANTPEQYVKFFYLSIYMNPNTYCESLLDRFDLDNSDDILAHLFVHINTGFSTFGHIATNFDRIERTNTNEVTLNNNQKVGVALGYDLRPANFSNVLYFSHHDEHPDGSMGKSLLQIKNFTNNPVQVFGLIYKTGVETPDSPGSGGASE